MQKFKKSKFPVIEANPTIIPINPIIHSNVHIDTLYVAHAKLSMANVHQLPNQLK